LKRRIIRNASLGQAQLVVELGPGNGGTTRAILEAMPAGSKLLSIELNQGLFELASQIEDARYTAHNGSAADLGSIMEKYGLDSPDVVISGIPFSCMDRETGSSILRVVHSQLKPGGRFVAYQLSPRVDELNTFYSPDKRSVEFEWMSIPPMRVWRWQK